MHGSEERLDAAARAAWLYYIHGRTQDEIAGRLGVSRQSVQRLVALAVAEGLIKFRLDHPLASCMGLAERLRGRFGLDLAEVAPQGEGIFGIAIVAAGVMERYFEAKAPTVIAVGTGRTLRAATAQVPRLARPQHKIVSIVGNTARDGRVSPYEAAQHLAERIGAACYPMPTPVVAATPDDRERMQAQSAWRSIQALAREARAVFVGVGHIGADAPLRLDDFIDDAEMAGLVRAGAVGEIVAWPLDAHGRVLDHPFVARLPGLDLRDLKGVPKIGVAAGAQKAGAIRAALEGGVLTGLVTDEPTAAALVEGA